MHEFNLCYGNGLSGEMNIFKSVGFRKIYDYHLLSVRYNFKLGASKTCIISNKHVYPTFL